MQKAPAQSDFSFEEVNLGNAIIVKKEKMDFVLRHDRATGTTTINLEEPYEVVETRRWPIKGTYPVQFQREVRFIRQNK